jgi:two-component system OmpR family response regulator
MLSSSIWSNPHTPLNLELLPAYLVEDSPLIRANLATTLEELCDIKVVATAESENEATAWLIQPGQKWRLAIVDLFLRPGSGIKVLAACKNRKPEQKVVVLTNYATPDIRKVCINLGADAVFDKSREVDALIDYCSELARNQSGMPTGSAHSSARNT